MTNHITPDLDTDTITHSFRNLRYDSTRPVYDIFRSINGRPSPHRIGTVIRLVEGNWNRTARWEGRSLDGTITSWGSTREGAAKALEFRLQGPEYAERKRAERIAAEAERQAKIAEVRETVRVREVYDRFEVILDDKLPAAATFVFRRITAIYNGEEIIEEVITFEGARKFAEDTARQIQRQRLHAAGLLS